MSVVVVTIGQSKSRKQGKLKSSAYSLYIYIYISVYRHCGFIESLQALGNASVKVNVCCVFSLQPTCNATITIKLGEVVVCFVQKIKI